MGELSNSLSCKGRHWERLLNTCAVCIECLLWCYFTLAALWEQYTVIRTYVFKYMHIHMYIHMYIYAHYSSWCVGTCTYTYIHNYVGPSTNSIYTVYMLPPQHQDHSHCMHIYVHTYIHMYTPSYWGVCTYVYANLQVYTYVRTYVSTWHCAST